MMAGGAVRTTARVVMKNLKLLPHYQEYRQTCIQHTHDFNNGRSKLCYFLLQFKHSPSTVVLTEHVETAVDVTYGMPVCILPGMHNSLPSSMPICFGNTVNTALQLHLRNYRIGWNMISMLSVWACSVRFFLLYAPM